MVCVQLAQAGQDRHPLTRLPSRRLALFFVEKQRADVSAGTGAEWAAVGDGWVETLRRRIQVLSPSHHRTPGRSGCWLGSHRAPGQEMQKGRRYDPSPES